LEVEMTVASRAPTRRGFRRVLCPIDFSRHSRAALRYASVLAERTGGELTVLVVNDPMLAAAAAAALHDTWRLDASTLTEVRRFVYRTLGTVGAKATLDVAVGRPAEQIDRVAQRLNADLIVMGTHGLSGPRKWFFGSTTEALFRLSKVPILAVPARARALARDLRGFPGKTMLAPIELEGTTRAEIRQVTEAAHRLDARLLFLHVVKPTQAPPWLLSKAGAIDRKRLSSAHERLHRLVGASAASRARIVVGDPVLEIEKTAQREKAAVIVMALKRHGLIGQRRGSIAYRVVCSGVASVLALPPSR
jgi:nucleotide-binding universal stress UspA family protein